MKVVVDRRIEVPRGYATERARGLYNVAPEDGARFLLEADVPTEREDWQIGVVVGPSGSGKTSIARELCREGWQEWEQTGRADVPVIDWLTELAGSFAKATAALAAVGLGSVPSWLRPFPVLSNGEQFRASMAALLLTDQGEDYVLDEFTSVLDRQVAKVGAGAFAKAWRRREGRRVVLVTPHADILDWVEPDWVIDTSEGLNKWAQDREVVPAREGAFRPDHRYDGPEVGRVAC